MKKLRLTTLASAGVALGLSLAAAQAARADAYPRPRPVRPIEQRLHQLERTVQLLEQRVRTLEYANGGGGQRYSTTCTLTTARGRTFSGTATDRYQAAEAARQQCMAYEDYYDCQGEPYCTTAGPRY